MPLDSRTLDYNRPMGRHVPSAPIPPAVNPLDEEARPVWGVRIRDEHALRDVGDLWFEGTARQIAAIHAERGTPTRVWRSLPDGGFVWVAAYDPGAAVVDYDPPVRALVSLDPEEGLR